MLYKKNGHVRYSGEGREEASKYLKPLEKELPGTVAKGGPERTRGRREGEKGLGLKKMTRGRIQARYT